MAVAPRGVAVWSAHWTRNGFDGKTSWGGRKESASQSPGVAGVRSAGPVWPFLETADVKCPSERSGSTTKQDGDGCVSPPLPHGSWWTRLLGTVLLGPCCSPPSPRPPAHTPGCSRSCAGPGPWGAGGASLPDVELLGTFWICCITL